MKELQRNTTMKFFKSYTAAFVAFFTARRRENHSFLTIFKLLHIQKYT